MASTTSDESMIEPSTIASGDSGSTPRRWRWNSPLRSRSSTSFTAELPISRPTTPFLVREKSTMNSPKVQRSRQFTPCYLKLRWKLPGKNTSVKVPMHLWLYCPVTELYTPPSAVARLISTNFPGFMGVCASLGSAEAKRSTESSCALTTICWGAYRGALLHTGSQDLGEKPGGVAWGACVLSEVANRNGLPCEETP